MDVLIIGAVLIMSCVIIGITLSEMQRLNKECDDLRRELEKVETQRESENTRHKNLQKALRDRLEEVREALSAPNTKPATISMEKEGSRETNGKHDIDSNVNSDLCDNCNMHRGNQHDGKRKQAT